LPLGNNGKKKKSAARKIGGGSLGGNKILVEYTLGGNRPTGHKREGGAQLGGEDI